jgi:hypothetical protein
MYSYDQGGPAKKKGIEIMKNMLIWISIGLLCLMPAISGCSSGGDDNESSENKSSEETPAATSEPEEDEQEKTPVYTKGSIAVSFMEASHSSISKLDTNTPIKAYKYKEQNLMTKDDLSALTSKLNSHLGTKFAEDLSTNSDATAISRSSDHRNATILLKGPESEDRQALKVNPHSKGFVFHSSQAKYLMPEANSENATAKTGAVLTRKNAPEFALNYLKNMDLMPKDQFGKLTVGKVSGIGIAGEDSPRIFTVYFIRELEGYPVVGNTRIVVSMAADGTLVSLIHKWPELEETVDEINQDPVSSSLVSGNDAVDRIGNLLNNYHNGTKVDTIDVRNSELVMYDDGKYIEPVLFASGDVNLKSGDSVEYDWIIPLLKNPQGKYEVGDDRLHPQSTPIAPIPDPAHFDSGNAD